MNLQYRIHLLTRLGEYMLSKEPDWQLAKERAGHENGWFIPEFVERAVTGIANSFLQKNKLENWVKNYPVSDTGKNPRSIGLVMAGNIPLVGFHDWLCVFVSGHHTRIKPSSKDKILIRHLTEKLIEWDPGIDEIIQFSELLKGCDAYIATGSNNSSRYFDYYFGKYPHIIRKNRTSIAILTGQETTQQLEDLADDVYLYFGLGCRNVTKIYVPAQYDFLPLLNAFRKYNYLADHFKYKNNYDYNLALLLLNKTQYMSNGSVLLVENPSLFSPISQLNYEFYRDRSRLLASLSDHTDIQCIAGKKPADFGQTQSPALTDYADGTDTLSFLTKL